MAEEIISSGIYYDTVIPISFNGIQPVGGDGHWDQGTYILQRDIQLRQK